MTDTSVCSTITYAVRGGKRLVHEESHQDLMEKTLTAQDLGLCESPGGLPGEEGKLFYMQVSPLYHFS